MIFNRFRRMMQGSTPSAADRMDLDALNQMRTDLKEARHGGEFLVTDLRPVLIPTTIFSGGGWPGPYRYFDELPVSLTWAFLRPHNTMLYLSHNAAADFERRGIDWRRESHEASWQGFRSQLWTHEFKGKSDRPEAVAFMHRDGLGPSRLLHATELLAIFPSGFQAFVPERSCAFVLDVKASPDIASKVERVVAGCFRDGTAPVSPTGFSNEALREALDGRPGRQ